MAAPSGTKWGSIKSGGAYLKGRIGIYVSTSNTSSTVTKASVQVWFWSIYSIKDVKNTLYLSNNSTSATKSRGNVSISTTVNSGSGWSTSNQQKLGTWTFDMSRKESKRTINIAAKLSTIDVVGSSMTVSTSYTVPARPKYTLTYNANGGSEGPDPQSMFYNTATTISNEIPVYSGYIFKGWGETNSSTSASWQPGEKITITANKTIYAIWQKNDGKVKLSYNANGGTGAPAIQTVAKNGTLTISSTTPTKFGYRFTAWNTQIDGSGSSYVGGNKITMGEDDKILYAQWQETAPYTVTYNANGGTGAPAEQGKYIGKILKLSSTIPTRSGYAFRGWVTDISEEAEEIDTYYPGNYYGEDASVTLYATWADTSKIKFTGGGDIEANIFSETSLVYGFAKTGLVFAPVFKEVEESNIQFNKTQTIVNEIIEI